MQHEGNVFSGTAVLFSIAFAICGVIAAWAAWPEPAASRLAAEFRPGQIALALTYLASGFAAAFLFWGLGAIVDHLAAIRAELVYARRSTDPERFRTLPPAVERDVVAGVRPL